MVLTSSACFYLSLYLSYTLTNKQTDRYNGKTIDKDILITFSFSYGIFKTPRLTDIICVNYTIIFRNTSFRLVNGVILRSN